MLPNLLKRSITGLLFVAIMVGAILYSYYSYVAIFGLIVLLSLNELYRLFNRQEGVGVNQYIHSIIGSTFFILTSLECGGVIYMGKKLIALTVIYLLFIVIRELYTVKSNPLRNWGFIALGHLYITFPLSLLSQIAFIPKANEGIEPIYTPIIVLALFLFIWSNDSGAYLVGSKIGKRRLFERISPKKSWEGFVGGVVCALIASQILAYFTTIYTPLIWAGISLVVALIGTFGDLSESLIKRSVGVKDSGNMLPGHGGILDRFDAIILAIPAVFAFLALLID